MERWVGKTAVVTGAASGIGEAITAALLEKRVNVLALDTQTEKLSLMVNKLEKHNMVKFGILRCDVSKEEDVENAFTFARYHFNGVDIMVNSAGVIDYRRIIESDRKALARLLNINVLGTAMCLTEAVRSMRQRNVEGHIFNINSITGHEIPTGSLSEEDGCNGFNLYPATKHGTVALTHSVRRELAAIKAPIRITSISPGLVNTNIAKQWPKVQEYLDKVKTLEPQDVADALIYALGTRPEVQITEITIRSTGEL